MCARARVRLVLSRPAQGQGKEIPLDRVAYGLAGSEPQRKRTIHCECYATLSRPNTNKPWSMPIMFIILSRDHKSCWHERLVERSTYSAVPSYVRGRRARAQATLGHRGSGVRAVSQYSERWKWNPLESVKAGGRCAGAACCQCEWVRAHPHGPPRPTRRA